MEIRHAEDKDRLLWNAFVAEHFPPAGAFLHSWEWGEFQERLGNRIGRFIIIEGEKCRGVVLAIRRQLPFGIQYAYLPRGPVLARELWESKKGTEHVFRLIKEAVQEKFSRCSFVRAEPASPPLPLFERTIIPPYYLQPKWNAVLDLSGSEEDIFAGFSRGLQQSVRKAERRGVTVELKPFPSLSEMKHIKKMQDDTVKRAGKKILPDDGYFEGLYVSIASFRESLTRAPLHSPALAILIAYQYGIPVAANLVICFASSATYLYGVAYTENMSSRAAPYLHWSSIRLMKRYGFRYYDLGAVDDERWPSISYFKRQFGTRTIQYGGLVDIIIKPLRYRLYGLARNLYKSRR